MTDSPTQSMSTAAENVQVLNRRVLIIDDSPEIHSDFTKILCGPTGRNADLARLGAALFGNATPSNGQPAKPAATNIRFEVDSAFQGEQAAVMVRAAVAAHRPYAMAFLDMRMPPGWDGLRTLIELWKADPHLNIVICTAYSDHAWTEIDLLAGNTDRLLVLKKPFETIEVKRLAATLTSKWDQSRRAEARTEDLESLVKLRTSELELARMADRQKLDELESVVEQRTAALRRAATHDELTGLPNRALFNDRLSQALERYRRDASHLVAVLFVDFDRFKVVNDSLGHHTGDLLLKSIADRLGKVLRPTDTVIPAPTPGLIEGEAASAARLGGDEFCVLLTGLKRPDDAAVVADRVIRAMQEPHQIQGREVHSTASIGVAVSTGEAPRAEEMLRDADTAMYRAKAAGRGRFVMFDRRMHAQAMERMAVETDLRRAIDRGELRTYYQPVVSLQSAKLAGFEALVRWDRGDAGVIGPADFIEVAEETGLVSAIGDWVLGEACRQLADWHRRLPQVSDTTLSVNVSPKQLSDRRLPERVGQVLKESGLEPSRLILEITEMALVENAAVAADVVAALKALGVRVYLDDFGTGYASLSCLHRFPLDGLKVDRSFVRDGAVHRRYAAVVYAIAHLAHNLGLDVIAEGVESLSQVALLQSVEIAKAQGYLFAPPLSAQDAEAFATRPACRGAA
jgi:predicted signal transduction protein with EAL and GGDEF domain